MISKFILAASALVAFAHAQTIETSSASSVAASTTVSQSMPAVATAGFNAANVSSATAFAWCHAQLNTCPQICGGSASSNQCDDTAFTYSCICANGTVPDCTAFTQTLPYYMCQATYAQCINDHPNDAEGQATCATDEQCGTRNATAEALAETSAASSSAAAATSSSSSSSSATAASTGSSSATGSSASSTATAKSDAMTQHVTTGAFVAVLMAAFKLLL
ncbi:hypothetical protein EDD37DRAFT_651276 [Exophiala viscosa]|uniref:DUF7707 domain-containing protein n=1 Tax=Exophiala viscosa TaxID=2486360 RepID=A0AAN6DTW7_9EURO|nr:hypothetical protein EDD36DRAFT_440117 [Exophiala viscosa]KAI1623088.1 hypothetical protein EDD37DRAFT_651276 [Exophiala viscosa]